jgi:hypothetical protein
MDRWVRCLSFPDECELIWRIVKQRGDAEKSITLPAAIRIMNRSQRMQDRDVMAWKEDRANRLKGLEGDDNLASG